MCFFVLCSLQGYKLDFTISAPERWNGGGCADVVATPGNEVWGSVYELSVQDMGHLDLAEDPRYRRVSVLVQDESIGTIQAFVYEVVDKAPLKEPSKQYLDVIRQAASEYKFPKAYQEYLAAIPLQP